MIRQPHKGCIYHRI